MSTVFRYPNGDCAVTLIDRPDMPGRSVHFRAAFCHVWDTTPTPERNHEYTFYVMRAQAYQWIQAFWRSA